MFFHGHTVKHIGFCDGPFIVGDDDELALADKTIEDFDEPVDVRFVERRVHFVEHAERARFDHVDREKEGNGGHGFFATG